MDTGTHPSQRVDDLVHQRTRLGVLALLSRSDRVSFTDLRDTLGQSDGGLGRHLRVLEEAGYILVEKAFENRRPRTWASLTDAGRAAVDTELGLLTELAEALRPGDDEPPPTAPLAVALAAPLAATAAGQRGSPAGTGPCAALILRDTYAGYSVSAEGPMGSGYQVPEGLAPWPGYEAQRMTFLSHGLRDGYLRCWRHDGGGPGRIAVLLVELGDAAAPHAVLNAFARSTAYVPGLPEARAYRLDRHASGMDAPAGGAGGADPAGSCVVWLAYDRFLACVSVSDAAGVVENRAATLARDQFRSLAAAVAPAGPPSAGPPPAAVAPSVPPPAGPPPPGGQVGAGQVGGGRVALRPAEARS